MTILAIYKILLRRRRRQGQKGRLARGDSRNANVDDDDDGGQEGSGREEEEEPGQQLKEYELMKWRRRVEREVELEMGIRMGEGGGGG